MMNRTIRIGMLALALCSFALPADAKQVFRFTAQWGSNADGANCDLPAISLIVFSFQADASTAFFDYSVVTGFCGRPGDVLDFQRFTGPGTVSVTGNQTKLHVTGTFLLSGEAGEAEIDLTLRKTGNLPDSGGDKVVSAVASGAVLLNGQNINAALPFTSGTITRSKS